MLDSLLLNRNYLLRAFEMGQALRSLVFRPPAPATYLSGNHFRWLPTREGSVIPAVYLQRKSSLVVLYSHGNAEDLGLALPYAQRCADVWRVSFFCYEYTGYGLSSGGAPSEEHLYSDVEAAYHYLIGSLQYSPSNIIVFGKSLGSIPATHIASLKCGIAALVLQSGLASIMRVKLPHISGRYPGDMGCNIDKIGKVKCPALIVHGCDDTLCTLSHAKALASKHAGITVTCYIEGAGHNDLDWPPFLARVDVAVTAFLRKVSTLVEAQDGYAKRTRGATAAAEAAAFARSLKHTRAAHQALYMNRRLQRSSSFLCPWHAAPSIAAATSSTADSDCCDVTLTTRSAVSLLQTRIEDENWPHHCRKISQQTRMLRVLQRFQLLQQNRLHSVSTKLISPSPERPETCSAIRTCSIGKRSATTSAESNECFLKHGLRYSYAFEEAVKMPGNDSMSTLLLPPRCEETFPTLLISSKSVTARHTMQCL